MKKAIIKGIVFGLIFFISVLVISRILNRGNNDLTVEMASATLPVVTMGTDDIFYNELHGYSQKMPEAVMRDTITVLNELRTTRFQIATYGTGVEEISYEVRSVDGERLIENTRVTEYELDGNVITGNITVKDLIEEDAEYEFIFLLNLADGRTIRYYTRLVWGTDYHLEEKLEFVNEFHEKSFDKEQVKELTKYMESNSEGDNSTLYRVDIHCSLNQLSWGNLSVEKVTEPVMSVTELAKQTASIEGSYIVSTQDEEGNLSYFYVEEYYRIRYSSDRMYLLDYARNMNSILDVNGDIYVNDKIMLGVESEDLPLYESEDGNVFAFVMEKRLYSYNVTTNKMAVIFGFYDEDNKDKRDMYTQHDIKVLDIDEGGNISFAVYGYMNRGRHEGEVGVQIYFYNSAVNTIEEELYIPYDGTYRILKAEMEQLLFLNKENYLYLMLNGSVREVNLQEKQDNLILEVLWDESVKVSDSNTMLVWQNGSSLYEADELILMDLSSREKREIEAADGDCILPLGFMGEDLIYGLAHKEDIREDGTGTTVFPMYGIYIRDASGNILKSYSQEGIYISGCSVQGNQITIDRLLKEENGYAATTQDYIMNNSEVSVGKNTIKSVVTENYGKYIQIAVKKNIDAKSIQILTPKEVLYEGEKELEVADEGRDRYYVYGSERATAIVRNPAQAVSLAESWSGSVIDETGGYVYRKTTRSTRNQIMAIKAAAVTEEKDSLAVCLDTMLAYEGIVKNAEYLLENGETPYSILDKNLEDAKILDLQGCSLEAVLYYVNLDYPVLAIQKDQSAVLIIGFNEYNVVLMNPETGTIYKAGMNDSQKWFEENGNHFLTYVKE